MHKEPCFEENDLDNDNPSKDRDSLRGKKIMVTLTGGGFLWEAKALIKGLGDDYEYHYVTSYYDFLKTPDAMAEQVSGIPEGKIYTIFRTTTMSEKSLGKKVRNTLISLRDAYKVIKKVEPVAVICIGTSLAVPLCFWARYFRRKAIFIESITRVSKPSLTGKILSSLRLCDRFYVQWPEAVHLYRGAIYRGGVL